LPNIKRNNILTYKSILRNIDQLVVGTIHMWNLGDKKTQKCYKNKTKKNQRYEETRQRLHTSQLWEEGTISSSFLEVKMSIPTKWHLAWPCFPVFEVETSTTCRKRIHPNPSITERNQVNHQSSKQTQKQNQVNHQSSKEAQKQRSVQITTKIPPTQPRLPYKGYK